MTTIQFDTASSKFFAIVEGKRIESSNKGYLQQKLKRFGKGSTQAASFAHTTPAVESEFSINQRFDFVKRIVNMVATGVQASMIITGEGGLGKTHTVLNTLRQAGLVDVTLLNDEFDISDINSFKVIKGFSTAKGLFRTLYENRNGVCVFDDCDSVLRDPVAVNLLKAALDSYSTRVISWNADMREEDLPRSFEFEGRVIFISNLPASKMDQAIRSRSMNVDLAMTAAQKIERMGVIMLEDDFMPGVPLQFKKDALAMIDECKDEAKEISLRTLISVTKIRSTGEGWEELAKYTLVG